MPRPSRHEEAQAVIDRFYAKYGVMPTIETLAREMGYQSTSSAHHTVAGLLRSGYLQREERGGRLLPGPAFTRPFQAAAEGHYAIPAEVLQALPRGVSLRVLQVEDDTMLDQAIRADDMLVIAPLERTDLSDLLVLRRGTRLAVSPHRKPGWKVEGALVAQFRSYR